MGVCKAPAENASVLLVPFNKHIVAVLPCWQLPVAQQQ